MDVSVVIVNYNTFELACACINSIINYTKNISYEIILVDNGSSFDPTLFKKTFPEINLIVSTSNLGFSKGNNLGISQSKGKYILLLNSDTELKENSIKITYDYLEKHSTAGVVSAKMIFPDGKAQSVCQRFPSIRFQLFELLRLQKLFPKKAAGKILLGAFFDHAENVKADWIWGTYFMFRMSILEQLPGKKLNDEYFMYCEDMQWCWDFKKLGYEVHYCAETEVVHYMGGSSGEKNILMTQNMNLFMIKNYNFVHRWLIKKINLLLLK